MPQVKKVLPKNLKPYQFHGLELIYEEGQEHATATCPFCGKERKFSINVESGLWRCLVCAEGSEKGGGNLITFLRLLWTLCDTKTNGHLKELAQERKILYPDTLDQWGVCWSPFTDNFLVPGYGIDNKLNQLYRYCITYPSKKRRLMATPETNTQLMGPPLFDPTKPDVYVCEGVWDAMALWEALRFSKPTQGHLTLTASDTASLYAKSNVLATPGCNTFNEKWLPLLAGKRVFIMFHNDHPREVNGKTFRAGYDGMKRLIKLMGSMEEPPKEVNYLYWGEEGHDATLPDGYDVRDLLALSNEVEGRVTQLEGILDRIKPIPPEWVPGRSAVSKSGSVEMEPVPCFDWRTLNLAWQRAMKWTDNLDITLSVMLAVVTSTKAVGDQLWAKVIGPPSTGKSTLCEALSVSKRFVVAKSTIRGFHSGFMTDKEGKQDNSLISLLYDKTLVTKDGDTLLQSPNVSQILSEARDLYDRTTRTSYRTGVNRDYTCLNVTWILCGTDSLRQLDSSELGERFLDCVLMDKIPDDLEAEILRRIAYRSQRGMALESDGTQTSQSDPDLVTAMQLTGGYVEYLRTNAQELLSAVDCPDDAMMSCIHLGLFVSYMRARPSKTQEESAEKEFAARLVSQMVRLANCIAVVLNKKTIDAEVIRRVRKVALDTARGRTLDVVTILRKNNRDGAEVGHIVHHSHETEDKLRTLLRFMKRIGIVEHHTTVQFKGMKGRVRWRLTEKLDKLYNNIFGGV